MKKHAAIFKTGSVAITLALAGIAWPHYGYGQQDCGTLTLSLANEQYEAGKFDEVMTILSPCLRQVKTDDERFSVHKLLAQTYIALDRFNDAEQEVKAMLLYKPDYSPNRSEETLLFSELVEKSRLALDKENIADILVTTATKRMQRSSDAPATIYVRTREQIIKRGYRNLLELLEDIPEVEIQRNSISEFRNMVTFRGIAGNEKFIIMLDGIRITPSTGDPYTLGTNYPLTNAMRVEVILGPASALYGVDAFSGIINIITMNDRDVQGGVVQTSFGHYTTGDHSVVVGLRKKDVGFTLAGNYYHSREPDLYNLYKDEFRWYNEKYKPEGLVNLNGAEKQVTPSASQRAFEMPASSYFLSAKLNFGNFEIGASRNHERHSSSVSVDPQFTLYTKEAFLATNLQSVYANYFYKSRSGRWSLQSYLSFNSYVMDPDSKFINQYTEYGSGYKYQYGQSQKFEEQWEYTINRHSSVIAGISLEGLHSLPKTADLPSALDPDIPADEQHFYYLNTDTIDAEGRSLAILQDFHYLNYQNYGVFIQFHSSAIKFTELTLGGRFDYNTRFGQVLSPRFGMVFKPSEKLKIKLLYGRSFLAPSPWKAYATFGAFQPQVQDGKITGLTSPFFHIPNTSLEPEKLSSMEGGITFLPSKLLLFSADVYYNRIHDLINIQAGQGPGSFKGVAVANIETAVNEGLAHTYGATFNATHVLQLGKDQLSLNTAYSYTGGDIDDKPLVLTAKHTIKTAIDWSHDPFSISLRWIYRSRSNSVVRDTEGRYLTNDAFSTVNVFARYAVMEREDFSLAVSSWINNVLNTRYYHVAAGQDSFPATPQDPIRVSLGASLTFR
jgi:iron complex outermembrane receptor protein